MCCGTTIFINNTPRIGCCMAPRIGYSGMMNPFSPGCFGYGFGVAPMGAYAAMGVGAGLGMAVGMALPGIFKGIGSVCKWGFNNVIAPAGKLIGKGVSWLYNKAIKPAWNGIKSFFGSIGKGIKNLWNKIF